MVVRVQLVESLAIAFREYLKLIIIIILNYSGAASARVNTAGVRFTHGNRNNCTPSKWKHPIIVSPGFFFTDRAYRFRNTIKHVREQNKPYTRHFSDRIARFQLVFRVLMASCPRSLINIGPTTRDDDLDENRQINMFLKISR